MSMRQWIGLHAYSTWMIVASIVVMAMTVHPSLLAYLFVAGNTGWMIVTREVARAEGITHPACRPCLIAGVLLAGAAVLVMMKINWLAL